MFKRTAEQKAWFGWWRCRATVQIRQNSFVHKNTKDLLYCVRLQRNRQPKSGKYAPTIRSASARGPSVFDAHSTADGTALTTNPLDRFNFVHTHTALASGIGAATGSQFSRTSVGMLALPVHNVLPFTLSLSKHTVRVYKYKLAIGEKTRFSAPKVFVFHCCTPSPIVRQHWVNLRNSLVHSPHCSFNFCLLCASVRGIVHIWRTAPCTQSANYRNSSSWIVTQVQFNMNIFGGFWDAGGLITSK